MKLIDISTPTHKNIFCKVDDSDFEFLNQWKWTAEKRKNCFYAIRGLCLGKGKQTTIRMHKFLIGSVLDVDHRDGDGLNNQRSNLREATVAQNGWNTKSQGGTSRFKGVCWSEKYTRWQCSMSVNNKHMLIGCFPTEDLAACAYNFAAKKYHGEFAVLNDCENFTKEEIEAARFRSARRKVKVQRPEFNTQFERQ